MAGKWICGERRERRERREQGEKRILRKNKLFKTVGKTLLIIYLINHDRQVSKLLNSPLFSFPSALSVLESCSLGKPTPLLSTEGTSAREWLPKTALPAASSAVKLLKPSKRMKPLKPSI